MCQALPGYNAELTMNYALYHDKHFMIKERIHENSLRTMQSNVEEINARLG